MMSQQVNKFLFFTHYDIFCDLLKYRRTEKCNLFVLYNKKIKLFIEDLVGFFGHGKGQKQIC